MIAYRNWKFRRNSEYLFSRCGVPWTPPFMESDTPPTRENTNGIYSYAQPNAPSPPSISGCIETGGIQVLHQDGTLRSQYASIKWVLAPQELKDPPLKTYPFITVYTSESPLEIFSRLLKEEEEKGSPKGLNLGTPTYKVLSPNKRLNYFPTIKPPWDFRLKSLIANHKQEYQELLGRLNEKGI